MCCGRGCTPHRPLVNADRDRITSAPMPAAVPVNPAQVAPAPARESRRNGRWWFRSDRKLTDVQVAYDGQTTPVPRIFHVQTDQMSGVVPTPATGIRRVAQRDTGAGGGCTP